MKPEEPTPTPAITGSSKCPSAEELTAFNVGRCPVDTLEAIGIHLDDCPKCASALTRLDDHDDDLISGLRASQDTEPFTDEECQHVVALVDSVSLEAVVEATPETSESEPDRSTAPWTRSIGPYLLLEKLGRGGMGVVYKARHTTLGKLVAIKVLSADRMRNAESVARFYREMQATGRLSHPNIIQATDAGQASGTHFLTMELVEGIDLARLADRLGPLAIPGACELVRQVAEGMQHIHEHGMVHRDIKPSNLMLAGVQVQGSGFRCQGSEFRVQQSGIARAGPES